MQKQLTRDHARASYLDARLARGDVMTTESMERLRTLINERMKTSGLMFGTFRCQQCATINDTPYGKCAEIRCKSFYFDDREAVTLNTSGFMDFAGWADKATVQPILSGFEAWVREMANNAEIGDRRRRQL